MNFNIRDYKPSDAFQVDAVGLAAFEQYANSYSDWSIFRNKISHMSILSESGEVIVAESENRIIGAVAYIGIGTNKAKAAFFDPQWPIMRMLVVNPEARGFGIGHLLATECIQRAKRDKATVFALHTTKIMNIALPMYERMGFKLYREAPEIHGVPYGIYIKQLEN